LRIAQAAHKQIYTLRSLPISYPADAAGALIGECLVVDA
jgi:hypothetical protein